MKKKRQEKRRLPEYAGGEITVFLSLSLTCICALLCGLLESARVAGSGWYLQTALNSSLDSLMSCYHRDIWEDYHLLLLEFEETDGLEKELFKYLDSYLESDLTYQLTKEELEVLPPVSVTDQGGKYLEEEIVDYMKFGIFNIEQNEDKLKELSDNMKEATSIGVLTEQYQADTKKALKLEKAIEDIGASLSAQEKYLEEGKNRLKNCDGEGFISEAERLIKELDKMPGLVKKYEKEADKLAESLREADKLAEEKKADLKEDTWGLLSDELYSFRAYTDKEGERRKQINGLTGLAASNKNMVEAAILEAEETLEYIDEWNDNHDDDDDDEELDEEELWEDVLQTVEPFFVDRSFSKPEIKDKKTMNILERIGQMPGEDLLSLVVPADKEVSMAAVSKASFPSVNFGSGDADLGGSGLRGMIDRALIGEYTVYHFTNVLSETEREFQYEQEYILNGFDSDRQNLKETVNTLLKLRGALNLLYLLKDSQKRGEADALAAAITGAAGIAPLSKVLSFFILTIWAFGESLMDIRCLLDGGNVPFIKNSGDWKLSLSDLLLLDFKNGFSGNGQGSSGTEKNGLDYQGYLRMFLLIQERVERNYRIMDMIQKNIGQTQREFLMAKCAVRLDVECRAKGKYAVLKNTAVRSY